MSWRTCHVLKGTVEIACPANAATPCAKVTPHFSPVRKLHQLQQRYSCNPRCREVGGVTSQELRLRWSGFHAMFSWVAGIKSHPQSLLKLVANPSETFPLFSVGFGQSPEWLICYLFCQVGNEYITTSRWHKQKEREEDIVMKGIGYLTWRPLKSAGSSGWGLLLKCWKCSTDSNFQTRALL